MARQIRLKLDAMFSNTNKILLKSSESATEQVRKLEIGTYQASAKGEEEKESSLEEITGLKNQLRIANMRISQLNEQLRSTRDLQSRNASTNLQTNWFSGIIGSVFGSSNSQVERTERLTRKNG